MPSPQVEAILANYQESPGPFLELPRDLSDADLVALAASGAFAEVQELRVERSRDADWTAGRFADFSASIPQLSGLHLSNSHELTDAGVRAVVATRTNLTRLNLHSCRLLTDVGVKAVAERLTHLHTLDIASCDKVTDAGIKYLATAHPKITGLHLDHCKWMTDAVLQVIADKCTNLQTLGLTKCEKITDTGVQALTDTLICLRTLIIRSCYQVTDAGVQAIAKKLTNLHALDIADCDKTTDAGATALADTSATLLSLDFTDCHQLTDISIKSLANKQTTLLKLDLRGCHKLTNGSFEALASKLTALNSIDISFCHRVTAVPESITSLQNIEHISLDGTRLTALPKSLRYLPRLRWLELRNIPGLKLPTELTNNPGNPRAILDYYFRTATEGKRALNEAKLILVGNEAVGKTSLVNYLVHKKPCRDSAKTTGVAIEEGVEAVGWEQDTSDTFVDVKPWKVHKSAAGETPLRLNVWDFGGQQVLYEIHQFFLTARSLYLVVLEARRENANEQEANLYAWLRSIRTRTIEPVPILVIINKSEPPHELYLDESKLIREFPSIRGFIRTSCRCPKEHKDGGLGIAKLRKSIVDIIRSDLPHVRDEFPLSYFNIKEKITKSSRKASILDADDYRKKCSDETVVDEREQNDLLTLFDCIGLVVKYNETTLLNPNWLTTVVYRLLTHEAVIAAQGEFSRDDLGTLLAGLTSADYPPNRWSFIIEIMKRFGLCFELPNHPNRYLLPNQLPEVDPQPMLGLPDLYFPQFPPPPPPKAQEDIRTEANNDPFLPSVERPEKRRSLENLKKAALSKGWRLWKEQPDELRFRYSYRHTPPRGLLPRLIVQAHQHLTNPRVAWLSGVVLHIQECEVLIRMNRQERRADISVCGPKTKRRDALAVVREYFAFVHEQNRFELETDFTPQIPINVPGKPDAAFDFEELETDERNGVENRWYKGYDHPFPVKALLAGIRREPTPQETRGEFGGSDRRVSGGIHIRDSVVSLSGGQFNSPQHNVRMGDNTRVDTGGGNVVGSALGAGAQVKAEQISNDVRQPLPATAPPANGLAEVLKAALAQLANEPIEGEDREEAEGAVKKIEKEFAKPVPNAKRVKGWLAAIEAISETVGQMLRGAIAERTE